MRTVRLIVLVLGLCSLAFGQSGSSLSLVDTTGRYLGTLPLIARGDERLVPLNSLAHKADWVLEMTHRAHIVTFGEQTVTLEAGNPFIRTENGLVQLRMVPQEWDGALWFPLTNLPDLFPKAVNYDARRNVIQVLSAVIETPAISAVSETKPKPSATPWTLKTVIIDPGHGGKDPGASGLFGLKEKDVTLDIANRLATLISSNGLAARVTRMDDRFVSLKDRSRFANDERGDLFLSIHCNSARDSAIRGAEAYFLKPAKTERAVHAAMRENSVVELENGDGQYPELTEQNFILLTMATSQYIKDSEAWADHVLTETLRSTKSESRGVDQAGFYVLMGASMPAILVECGYLSNPTDAKLLGSEDGRQRIAEAMFNSILTMKSSMETSASR